MAFDPTCLPPLPSCVEDMESWAEDLISCLTANFTSAFNSIASIAVPPFNICEEIGSLGPDCFLTPEGIDQTRFTYAESPDDVVAGNGVLPTPPLPTSIEYRAGAIQINSGTCAAKGSDTAYFYPPMSTQNYSIFLTMGNDVPCYVWAPPDARQLDRCNIHVSPRDCETGENENVWVYWLAIKINS